MEKALTAARERALSLHSMTPRPGRTPRATVLTPRGPAPEAAAGSTPVRPVRGDGPEIKEIRVRPLALGIRASTRAVLLGFIAPVGL